MRKFSKPKKYCLQEATEIPVFAPGRQRKNGNLYSRYAAPLRQGHLLVIQDGTHIEVVLLMGSFTLESV